MKYKYRLLGLIVGLGLVLRVVSLNKNPPALFVDEMTIGLDAYRLVVDSESQWRALGHRLPESLGEFTNPIPRYAAAPFVWLLGLNEWGVRLPTALFGTLTIILVYVWASQEFGVKTGLWSALMVAIEPWHVFLSRFGVDFVYTPLLMLLALVFFKAAEKNRLWLPLGMGVVAGASYSSYAARVYVPVLALVLGWRYKRLLLKRKNRSFLMWGVVLMVVLLLPHLLAMESGRWFERYEATSVFADEGMPLAYKLRFAAVNFVYSVSMWFLFVKGETSFPGAWWSRHSVPGMGVLYWTQLPLMMLGGWSLWRQLRSKKKIKRERGWLVFWLLMIYPLGNVLADNHVPHAGRLLWGAVICSLVSGLGWVSLERMKRFGWSRWVVLAGLMVELVVFEFRLITYPQNRSVYGLSGWDYGVKQALSYVFENNFDDVYDEINMPHMFAETYFRFYSKDGCSNCYQQGAEAYDRGKKQLFVVSSSKFMQMDGLGVNELFAVLDPFGRPAYRVLEAGESDELSQ